MKSERFLCHATGRWVQGSACLQKVERNQSSDVHNTLVVNSSRPPALGVWLCVPLPACPRKHQQLGPRRVNTKQVRNKKHHANPPLLKLELQACVIIHMSTLKTISGQHTCFLTKPVLHNTALQSCWNFRVSTLQTVSGKHCFLTWNLTGALCGLLPASENICCICSVSGLVGTRLIHCVVFCQLPKTYAAFASCLGGLGRHSDLAKWLA